MVQQRRARVEREANRRAKADGAVLPFPNPWDDLMEKLPEGSSEQAHLAWLGELAERCAPGRIAHESNSRQET